MPTGPTSILAGLNQETTQLLVEAGINNRFSGGKLPHTATVTASGDTTILTPAGGKKLIVYWVQAVSDPTSVTPPISRPCGTEIGAPPAPSAASPQSWRGSTSAACPRIGTTRPSSTAAGTAVA